jgi:hypothetical protein
MVIRGGCRGGGSEPRMSQNGRFGRQMSHLHGPWPSPPGSPVVVRKNVVSRETCSPPQESRRDRARRLPSCMAWTRATGMV